MKVIRETIGKDVIRVVSETNPKVTYNVDLINGRCSCPAWIHQRGGSRLPCKHLRQLGYHERLLTTRGIRNAALTR